MECVVFLSHPPILSPARHSPVIGRALSTGTLAETASALFPAGKHLAYSPEHAPKGQSRAVFLGSWKRGRFALYVMGLPLLLE